MKRLTLLIIVTALISIWACDTPRENGCDATPAPDPVATDIAVTGPIGSDAGKGVPWMTSWEDLSKRGYVEEEFFFEGDATYYKLDEEMTGDGKWSVSPTHQAPYKTRLLVRRPSDPAKFNGTVVVEWFNVSGMVDAAPAWMFLEPFLTREGYIWVGVSAQKQGVSGNGAGPIQPLVKHDPERYGSLVHPGDAYSYDIYTQAAKVIKGEGSKEVLGGLTAERLLAYGESQSAFTMITYTNGIQPIANVYDGLFIHSRSSIAVPLEGQWGTAGQDGFEDDATRAGCGGPMAGGIPVQVRTDIKVPVIQFETETDVAGFYQARQPDTDKIRTWEVPGTAHADYYLASRITEADNKDAVPEGAEMFTCESGNKGPHYIVLRAALKALDNWVKDGTAPPKAEPLAMEDGKILKDEHENALGGIRTPQVDVPSSNLRPMPVMGGFSIVDMLTGANRDGGGCGAGGRNAESSGCEAFMGVACSVFGATVPFTPEKLQELYSSHEDYVTKFKASAEATVAAGFMLEEEAAALIKKAEESPIPSEYADVW